MSEAERKHWSSGAHERKVENLYSPGVENYADFHHGYLNFGLWENGNTDYVTAAENLVHRMGTLAGISQTSKVLDVGTGMGTQDIYCLQNFSPLFIEGLDITWKHIEHARRRAREAGVEDRLRFHHGTATEIPFPDNSFTHVLSIEAPEHFDTREKFLREALRVLQPGGVIALADFVPKRMPRNLLERFVGESARRLWKVPRENIYLTDVYEEKLRTLGYEGVEIQEIGAAVIPGYYFEQRRPETIREVTKIRGFVAGRLGVVIDVAVYQAFKLGVLEYLLVRAEKPR
jgi:ubiquinone/menaquinone biosynthesis C-methylase UbiE